MNHDVFCEVVLDSDSVSKTAKRAWFWGYAVSCIAVEKALWIMSLHSCLPPKPA